MKDHVKQRKTKRTKQEDFLTKEEKHKKKKEKKGFLFTETKKLDGVDPVDNRPSTN